MSQKHPTQKTPKSPSARALAVVDKGIQENIFYVSISATDKDNPANSLNIFASRHDAALQLDEHPEALAHFESTYGMSQGQEPHSTAK